MTRGSCLLLFLLVLTSFTSGNPLSKSEEVVSKKVSCLLSYWNSISLPTHQRLYLAYASSVVKEATTAPNQLDCKFYITWPKWTRLIRLHEKIKKWFISFLIGPIHWKRTWPFLYDVIGLFLSRDANPTIWLVRGHSDPLYNSPLLRFAPKGTDWWANQDCNWIP